MASKLITFKFIMNFMIHKWFFWKIKKNLPRVRIELTTFRLWDWRAAYCATEAWCQPEVLIWYINMAFVMGCFKWSQWSGMLLVEELFAFFLNFLFFLPYWSLFNVSDNLFPFSALLSFFHLFILSLFPSLFHSFYLPYFVHSLIHSFFPSFIISFFFFPSVYLSLYHSFFHLLSTKTTVSSGLSASNLVWQRYLLCTKF